MLSLQFIGGGNMGAALLAGLISAGWAKPKKLAVVEAVAERRAQLQEMFPKVAIGETPHQAVPALLAVKPDDVEAALQPLAEDNVNQVLSIVAGVRTQTLEKHLGKGARVVRAMPNTPATLGLGMSAIAPGTNATTEDETWAEGILLAVGKVVRLEESSLDAVTGLSGSGPAYVFYLAEALISAGIEVGLTPEVADVLVMQTLLGSAQMLLEAGVTAEELRRQVSSPKGTTEKAIEVLEQAEVKTAFITAIKKAVERAGEIAEENN